MSLDKTNGELIGNLGRGYRVVRPEILNGTDLWEFAVKNAIVGFRKKGAMLPIHISNDDALVQIYPTQNKIAFVFARRIAGKEYLVPQVYSFDHKIRKQLIAKGLMDMVN